MSITIFCISQEDSERERAPQERNGGGGGKQFDGAQHARRRSVSTWKRSSACGGAGRKCHGGQRRQRRFELRCSPVVSSTLALCGCERCASGKGAYRYRYNDVAVALVVRNGELEVARLRLIDGAHVVAEVELILDREEVVSHHPCLARACLKPQARART